MFINPGEDSLQEEIALTAQCSRDDVFKFSCKKTNVGIYPNLHM